MKMQEDYALCLRQARLAAARNDIEAVESWTKLAERYIAIGERYRALIGLAPGPAVTPRRRWKVRP